MVVLLRTHGRVYEVLSSQFDLLCCQPQEPAPPSPEHAPPATPPVARRLTELSEVSECEEITPSAELRFLMPTMQDLTVPLSPPQPSKELIWFHSRLLVVVPAASLAKSCKELYVSMQHMLRSGDLASSGHGPDGTGRAWGPRTRSHLGSLPGPEEKGKALFPAVAL